MTEAEFYRQQVEAMDEFVEVWGSLMESYLRNNSDLRQCVEGYVSARISREEMQFRLQLCEQRGRR